MTLFFWLLSNCFATEPLRWAADTTAGPPFVYQNPRRPTELIGFEYELIQLIARELGRKPIFVENAWEGLVPGLERSQYDVVMNGLEITKDREEQILFSEPYYWTHEQLVVRRSQEGILGLADLRQKRVGTLKASLAERILREQPLVEILSYDSETNAYEDLKHGRSDAVLLDWPIALYFAKNDPALKFVGEPIGHLAYGIGMRKSDRQLKEQIDQALARLKISGEFFEVFARWNLWNDSMRAKFGEHPRLQIKPVMYLSQVEFLNESRTGAGRFQRYLQFLPLLMKGAWMTLQISVLSMLLAIVIGLVIALVRLYGSRPMAGLARLYVEIMRGTPLLIQLYLIFYAAPSLGLELNPFVAAILGLGLNYGAYESENYRTGLTSLPRAQSEAGYALGMSPWQCLRYVLLPQALRVALPPVTNDFIALIKDSSLVSVITMVELTKTYSQLASTYYDFLGLGLLVAFIYLLLGLPFVRLSRYFEKKMAKGLPNFRGHR